MLLIFVRNSATRYHTNFRTQRALWAIANGKLCIDDLPENDVEFICTKRSVAGIRSLCWFNNNDLRFGLEERITTSLSGLRIHNKHTGPYKHDRNWVD